MGIPHRQHVTRPACTRGARARRRRWWAVPYPRCAVVPRARSRARVCSGHRETPGGHGTVHPCSRHGCLARAMVSTSVRVADGPHGCVAMGAVIPCAHRGGAGGRDVWGSGCPATAGEPTRVGPAWGYGTVGSLLVRGVRTVSSCGRPGRDPGCVCSAGGIRTLVPSFPGRWPRRRMSARLTPLWPLRVRHCSCSHQDSNLDGIAPNGF